MQTFLPYADFEQTFKCLDYRRLGKQRVEAKQLINSFDPDYTGGWHNHPARKMWEGYIDALKVYHDFCIIEWIDRGYKNTMPLFFEQDELADMCVDVPEWLGNKKFHDSHKSNLLRKDPVYYAKFGWNVDPMQPYVWPKNNTN